MFANIRRVAPDAIESIAFSDKIRVFKQLLTSELTFGMTNSITLVMSVAKVTISIESNLLKKVDRLVKERVFSNRSQAVQSAVEEKISRLDSNRLARECSKLNKTEEQSLADLGLASEAEEWLEY